MKITALAPWAGSKRTIAQRIIEALGPHAAYWEVFCGSMAVLLAKQPATMETVNDLHGDLVNLARVIQHDRLGPALYRRLRRCWMAETLHVEAAERYAARGYQPAGESPDLDRAADYFLCAWLGRNGVAGSGSYNQGFCVGYWFGWWACEKDMKTKTKIKLTREGLPACSADWTPADWRDLHEAVEYAKRLIAYRHIGERTATHLAEVRSADTAREAARVFGKRVGLKVMDFEPCGRFRLLGDDRTFLVSRRGFKRYSIGWI